MPMSLWVEKIFVSGWYFNFTKFVVDHSERAFYKELVKVVEASDVILEVLDARDPLGTRCVDMEKMVIKSGAEKHLVLLLNKIGMYAFYYSHDPIMFILVTPSLILLYIVMFFIQHLSEFLFYFFHICHAMIFIYQIQ